MRCPRCSSLEDRVIDSRIQRDGDLIRRRRECALCGTRFTTVETVLRFDLVVVKRDGRREEFDRSKILAGLRRACEKRPVQAEQLAALVEEVAGEVEQRGVEEIPSREIGDLVMERLKRIDKIAYVRYASVYKDFRDVSEFMEELSRLEGAAPAGEDVP